MNKSDLVTIRNTVNADRSFIFSTWLRGLRYGNSWFKLIDADSYYKHYHKVIEGLLQHPDTIIKVACLKEDSDVILGYVVYRNNILDYVFVKTAWRNIGIAKMLVPADFKIVSHLTATGQNMLKKYPGVIFNPFFT